MPFNALTVSIVIPVYNEENYLKDCLDSIAEQTVRPLEVFVVDNNSTDLSPKIAASYPFVTLLYEKRQGQVFARSKAFNKAKGDILGCVDADSILPEDWVESMVNRFEDEDVVAVTGDADPYDTPFKSAAGAVFRFYHATVSCFASGHSMLWGANCAFRRSAWRKIKTQLSYRRDVWEDYEMSFYLARLGQIVHEPSIKLGCSFRAAHQTLVKQYEYQFRAVRTFALNTSRSRTALFAVMWYSLLLLYPIARIDNAVLEKRRARADAVV